MAVLHSEYLKYNIGLTIDIFCRICDYWVLVSSMVMENKELFIFYNE